MGDIPLAPLSLLVLDTTSAPRSRHRYRTGRPVPSAEHGNVVPDVPPTLSRAGCGACGGGERPCQRHVSPHNPSRFETTVDTPALATTSPHNVTFGPAWIRVVIMSARTSTSPAPSSVATARRLLRGTTFGTSFSRGRAAGGRRVRRQSPPPGPSKSPTPFHALQYPQPETGLRLQCPRPSRQSSAGVAQTTRSATHPVHLRRAKWARCHRQSGRPLTGVEPEPHLRGPQALPGPQLEAPV